MFTYIISLGMGHQTSVSLVRGREEDEGGEKGVVDCHRWEQRKEFDLMD